MPLELQRIATTSRAWLGRFRVVTKERDLFDLAMLLARDLDPKVLSRYVVAPSPSYVSLLSTLRFHGMISQIPRSTYVVTLGRPQEVDTSLGDFSLHTAAPEVFGGFVATPQGALIASPEKALFDVFYLSGTKPRTFSSLPEVALPDDFDFGKVRSWTRKVPTSERSPASSLFDRRSPRRARRGGRAREDTQLVDR